MRSIIHNVREQTAALRTALLAPSIEGLQAHLPALQAAALALQSLQADLPDASIRLRTPEPETRRELEALARDLGVAGRLVAHGLAFQLGLARLMASASAGYRPDGEPVPLKTAASISVRG
jgi:hypothetical protein